MLVAFPSPLMHFVVVALFALLGPVAGDLNILIWNNTALAPLGAAQVSVTPSADLSGFSNYTSARLTGSITLPPGEVEFSVVGDGSILMWIDDHLVIDGLKASGSVRSLSASTNITFTGASQTFRLDYIHNAGASVLEVQANSAPIPASYLSTTVTPFEVRATRFGREFAPPCLLSIVVFAIHTLLVLLFRSLVDPRSWSGSS